MKNKIVSIILARGGSKGIHRKNLVDINGKPMLAYSIQASIESNVHETWVSSDDDEILQTAEFYGAKIIKRPDVYASDTATSESALIHFATEKFFDWLVFIQPTSPMILPGDINSGLALMHHFDSVISVTEITQLVWINGKPQYDINNRQRRQDSDKTYLETGSIFITTRDALLRNKNRISGNVGYIQIPKSRSFDIDDFEDLNLVRRLMCDSKN